MQTKTTLLHKAFSLYNFLCHLGLVSSPHRGLKRRPKRTAGPPPTSPPGTGQATETFSRPSHTGRDSGSGHRTRAPRTQKLSSWSLVSGCVCFVPLPPVCDVNGDDVAAAAANNLLL